MYFESLFEVSWQSWGHLGAFWVPLVALLRPRSLGSRLEASRGLLGTSWGRLGAPLGASGGHLGAILAEIDQRRGCITLVSPCQEDCGQGPSNINYCGLLAET
eukprot:3768296-Pyramimonas_sp.AAC.1